MDAFDSGVVFVPLASLISADDLPAALAYALGIGDVVHDLMGEIYRQADQDRLIVLDNFEHIAGAAPLIGSLLANAPNATLLVTSRTPLNLMEEWVYPVGGMAVTDPQDGAAALFVRHAARVNAKFNGARHSDDVRALCEALDGMPLAIELAATWARLLSPGRDSGAPARRRGVPRHGAAGSAGAPTQPAHRVRVLLVAAVTECAADAVRRFGVSRRLPRYARRRGYRRVADVADIAGRVG
ncbi:MAG: hypothetical protein HND48_04015 [Chloroflexi bacterium]|nr:hypothetical protein [Chloroflexota bacterium]